MSLVGFLVAKDQYKKKAATASRFLIRSCLTSFSFTQLIIVNLKNFSFLVNVISPSQWLFLLKLSELVVYSLN